MKNILVALLMIATLTCIGQECDELARNKNSEHVRFPDNTSGPKSSINKAAINPRLAKAESWIKGILNNFTGAELAFSNNYRFDPISDDWDNLNKATGVKGYYYSQMRFFTYYCAGNKMTKEGESGSSVLIYFNNIFAGYGIHSLVDYNGLNFKVNGKVIYKIYEKKYTQGRIDYYERMFQSQVRDTLFGSKDDYYIVRNSDKPVFIPLTRKEYLQQLLKDIDSSRTYRIDFVKKMYDPKNEAANKAKFDAELARIDNSKMYTKEQMAPYRKRFIETWQTEQQKQDSVIRKIEADTKGGKEVILEYMKKPEQWLSGPLKDIFGTPNTEIYSAGALKAYFDDQDFVRYKASEVTATILVTLNADYFNKSLSADVPQVILVQLWKNGYRHMKKVADMISQPGALAPLEAILAQGKSMPTPAPILNTPYKLSYLPKLNSITPLVIPADIKLSTIPVTPVNTRPTTGKLNIELPKPSPLLGQLSTQVLSAEYYKIYLQDLASKISNAISPEEKRKADEYLKNKKLSSSKDISNTALAAWIQKNPKASLYLYSKAVVSNTNDALAASNFAAFLIMGRLPEKAVPILKYLNKQRPAEPLILANLGNAYFRLGDMNEATKWLKEAVEKDSLNPIANKLLCIYYIKTGDTKKAKEHGERSITKCNDEEVIAVLKQIDNKIKPGEIMSRYPPLPAKEFPMLQRVKLPVMPARLDDMEEFAIELNAMKQSLSMTISDIESRIPATTDSIKQLAMASTFMSGMPSMRLKAQYIIMDGMQVYQAEGLKEAEVFHHNLKKKYALYNNEMKAITKKYGEQMKGLKSGEGGDEPKIMALELAQCKEINAATEPHLAGISRLINQYAERRDYLLRKFYRDYAYWAPKWVGETTVPFPSIERDYLKDVLNILSEYKIFSKTNCEAFETLPGKEGALQEWEDEFCANFKGKIGIGPAKIVWNCNSYAIEAGEGIVGGIGMNYKDDGSFDDFYGELGWGVSWSMGEEHIAKVGAGASVKEFVKFGPSDKTGEWEVKDAGVKGEVAIEAEVGNVGVEAKVIEVTAGYRTVTTKEGLIVPILGLK